MYRTILTISLVAMPITALAYESRSQVDERLVHKYSRFAGSEANAEALVEGLRYDRPVKLTSKSGSTTRFTPDTQKMGWGNVDNALAIAKGSLAQHGIYRPTPDQIKAALDGGYITTKSRERVLMKGVLDQRASGMGWGKIAQQHGFKLGEVKGHGHKYEHGHRKDWKHGHRKDWKDGHKHADWKHDRHDRKHGHDRHDWKHDRGDYHRARFDRPERPHKFDKPERPERHHRR